jgi:hypothetical protein
MSPIVDQKALEDFLQSADLGEARRAEAALEAMAASVRLRVVELETRNGGGEWFGSSGSRRRIRGEMS